MENEDRRRSFPLPPAFVDRMRALLGPEAGAFLASCEAIPDAGLRVNTLKISAPDFAKRAPWPLRPIPWCPNGFYIPPDARSGRHPWHAAGLYYLQEPSAMAVAEAFGLNGGETVLDLSASPGGKSTHIAGLLRDTGLLVANDPVRSRIKPLGENLERWGVMNALITNLSAGSLALAVPDSFDCVLLDAPCSGEGLFRRMPTARREWSQERVLGSARRQSAILETARHLVKPGGKLLYSTCTFYPEENEAQIAAFLDCHPDWQILEIPKRSGIAPGRVDWLPTSRPDIARMARLWPHLLDGDGHVLALLQRRDGDRIAPDRNDGPALESPDQTTQLLWEEFRRQTIPGFEPAGTLRLIGDRVYASPTGIEWFASIPLVRPGLWLGTLHAGRFEPSHALALAPKADQVPSRLDLDLEQASRYLAGEPISSAGESGWTLVTVDGFPLGWGKRSAGMVKNHYPKGLRRPLGSWHSGTRF